MKNIIIFHLKITIFTVVRNRSILHRRVIVMHEINRVDISWLHHGHRHTVNSIKTEDINKYVKFVLLIKMSA